MTNAKKAKRYEYMNDLIKFFLFFLLFLGLRLLLQSLFPDFSFSFMLFHEDFKPMSQILELIIFCAFLTWLLFRLVPTIKNLHDYIFAFFGVFGFMAGVISLYIVFKKKQKQNNNSN